VPCTGCLYCMDVRNRNKPLECRVNAALGREKDYVIKPAHKKKKVLIAGGGLAGMEAARVAALRGHEVMLYEKGTKLGGLIPLAALVKDFEIDDLMALIHYYKIQLDQLGVSLKLGKEVDTTVVEEFKLDVLILACGGVPNNLDIPGSNRDYVLNSSELHRLLRFYMRFLGPKMLNRLTKCWMPIGKRVIVIGGTIIGCELAEFLTKRRRKVTIVHRDDELGAGMIKDDLLRLIPWLEKKGATIFTGATYHEITEQGLVITTREGKKTALEADTIVVALPLLPDTNTTKSLEGNAGETYTIGDSREPQMMAQAVADGARIGFMI